MTLNGNLVFSCPLKMKGWKRKSADEWDKDQAKWIVSLIIGCENVGFDWQTMNKCFVEQRKWDERVGEEKRRRWTDGGSQCSMHMHCALHLPKNASEHTTTPPQNIHKTLNHEWTSEVLLLDAFCLMKNRSSLYSLSVYTVPLIHIIHTVHLLTSQGIYVSLDLNIHPVACTYCSPTIDGIDTLEINKKYCVISYSEYNWSNSNVKY